MFHRKETAALRHELHHAHRDIDRLTKELEALHRANGILRTQHARLVTVKRLLSQRVADQAEELDRLRKSQKS